jgi:AcrR family transcriptional regulator
MTSDGAHMWIEAGMDELAKSGIGGVRVEVLAQNLGITKGGFYRRFKDRRALLDAMLDTWAKGRIAVIEKQMELGDATPEERLKSVIKLFAERVNAQGMEIELAIRQWARSDEGAATAAARVDAARLKSVAKLYGTMGLSPQHAEARAVLFYAYIFGQGMLFLDPSPRKRANLVTACADVLTSLAAVRGDGPKKEHRQ